MEFKVGDLVKINTFDDGNQKYKFEENKWIITNFKYNKSKSIIKNVINETIKEFSISSWKLNKLIYKNKWINQPS
jgi:hypothetical protein|tara:strand:+ start:327 stop:551 length:225 start_codon:yes stop_codon:yes gene_type:complete